LGVVGLAGTRLLEDCFAGDACGRRSPLFVRSTVTVAVVLAPFAAVRSVNA
jgi:hypothetical protein